jgi:23S rRNA (uracil1939-C5)-methyltransferase
MAEKAQQHVLSRVTPGKTILDLFCGVGTFSIPLAKQADYLVGVELSAEGIQTAKENALQLPQRNTLFISADVAKHLQQLEKENRKFDIIVADPPRAGLSKKILRRMLRLQPKQFIYISCNPASLQRDLKWLSEYCEFEVNDAAIFDFFPHTEHVETIVDIQLKEIWMEKVNSERKSSNADAEIES